LTPLTRIHRPSRNREVFHLARYAVFKITFELLRSLEVWLTQSKNCR
jgi:hypothetical protein